jgi:multiple sugar transport system ATP-binding protein
MNFFDASLHNGGEQYHLSLNGHILKLNREHCEALSKKNYRERMIVAGIRPEDVIITGEGDDTILCKIELAEPVGPEMYVHLQSEKISLIARMKNDYGIKPGQKLSVKLDTVKLHLFDPVTEKNILSAD